MTFRDLDYLVAVARLSHFGKAAGECHVSQSALSLQLQKLEREVGAQLLERTNRRVVVTAVGKEVVRRAQDLLQGRRELLEAARHFSGELPATVTIGAIPTIAPFVFADLQAGFRRRFPATTPRFDEEVTGVLVDAVATGELDAGLVATPLEDTLLDEIGLFEEPFLLAVSDRHPLAQRRGVSPKDLAAERLLLLKNTHCLREQVIEFCSAHRVSGSQQSAVASIATLLAIVRSNGGVTLIPKMAAGPGSEPPGIRLLPVVPPPTRLVRVIFRKTSRVGRRLAEVIRMCVVQNEGG